MPAEHNHPKKHHKRHLLLHQYLDEIISDFIYHTESLPSEASLLDLMQWSHKQTIKPTEREENNDQSLD